MRCVLKSNFIDNNIRSDWLLIWLKFSLFVRTIKVEKSTYAFYKISFVELFSFCLLCR